MPRGLVSEDRFLGLLVEALRSRLEPRLEDYAGAFAVAEKLRFASVVEEFPRTFALLRLMLRASRSVLDAVLSREAFEVGFGVDFGAFALLAVPELEPYLLRGLESFFAEAWRAAELARSGRYVLLGGGVAAVAVDEVVRRRLCGVRWWIWVCCVLTRLWLLWLGMCVRLVVSWFGAPIRVLISI